MTLLQPLNLGDQVQSDFSIVQGFEFKPGDFDEPHIGVTAIVSSQGIFPNPTYENYWLSLGAAENAIWRPGHDMKGASIIGSLVTLLVDQYAQQGFMEEAPEHSIWGEVVSFDGVTRDPDSNATYSDLLPHVDFVPPELGCAVLFASNVGGTVGWKGQFNYLGTAKPSYAEQIDNMAMEISQPEAFLFSPDARTFLHARNEGQNNKKRILARIFMGPNDTSLL